MQNSASRPFVASVSICMLAMFGWACSSISTEQIGDILSGDDLLDTQTVVAGLKEALTVGTERTVATTSKSDGYWANPLIRIIIPSEFKSVANTLRDIGLGEEVARFELSMNRAAEQAAGEATDVFWNAIKKMSIADAWGILNGDDSAATVYFRQQTSDDLRKRFMPIVQQKMSDVGLYTTYNTIMDTYNKIPLVSKPNLNLDDYVTDGALNGLFTVLASEEKRIRDDPVARTTDLLRRVFSKGASGE